VAGEEDTGCKVGNRGTVGGRDFGVDRGESMDKCIVKDGIQGERDAERCHKLGPWMVRRSLHM
jgi:hypothetical protein